MPVPEAGGKWCWVLEQLDVHQCSCAGGCPRPHWLGWRLQSPPLAWKLGAGQGEAEAAALSAGGPGRWLMAAEMKKGSGQEGGVMAELSSAGDGDQGGQQCPPAPISPHIWAELCRQGEHCGWGVPGLAGEWGQTGTHTSQRDLHPPGAGREQRLGVRLGRRQAAPGSLCLHEARVLTFMYLPSKCHGSLTPPPPPQLCPALGTAQCRV